MTVDVTPRRCQKSKLQCRGPSARWDRMDRCERDGSRGQMGPGNGADAWSSRREMGTMLTIQAK